MDTPPTGREYIDRVGANSPHLEPHPEPDHSIMASPTTGEMPTKRPNIQFMDLPSELHYQIASFLSYPDALALKHSCSHFYYTVYTGVHLKVNWLVERFERKLECPMEKCSFRTDEAFCNWRIRRIMERRRQHRECRRISGGCWVVEGQTCQTDLVALWLKGRGTRKFVKSLATLGREALIIGALAILLEMLWRLTINQFADWFANTVVTE